MIYTKLYMASRQFGTILKHHEWYKSLIVRATHLITCLPCDYKKSSLGLIIQTKYSHWTQVDIKVDNLLSDRSIWLLSDKVVEKLQKERSVAMVRIIALSGNNVLNFTQGKLTVNLPVLS